MRVLRRTSPPESPPSHIVTAGAGLIAGASGVVFAVSLLAGAPIDVYGTAVAVGSFALAFALRRVAVATYPYVTATEERKPPQGAEEPIAEVQPVARRRLLRRTLWLGAGTFLASLLAPVAVLGPGSPRAPVRTQERTDWEAGVRLADDRGELVRPGDIAEGGFATVFPEGVTRRDSATVVLLRLSAAPPQEPTRLEWVVDGDLVAYSKLCTHMGCPIGLFRTGDSVLFCPCHQASFDAARGAAPLSGPASRPLPQLPLGVGEDGYLVALADFAEAVGGPVGRGDGP